MRAKAPNGAGRVRPITIGFRVTREQNAAMREVLAGLEIDPGWRVISENTHEAGIVCGECWP